MQNIIYTNNIKGDLATIIGREASDRIVLLTDATTHRLCRPLLGELADSFDSEITIGATDVNKTLETLTTVWTGLQQAGCTRHSLLINLGGGMVTDLGGFAAATFKRGIRFVNIPTTLLSMVDAAVGGKTGINFGGLKNEIGAFAEASDVIICTEFLRTLDAERSASWQGDACSGKNIRSGYAEMLKHSLLADEAMWTRHVSYDLAHPDLAVLQDLVSESIALKQRIVTEDPHEHGIRKALNLGHTVGHAFESFFMAQHSETSPHPLPMLRTAGGAPSLLSSRGSAFGNKSEAPMGEGGGRGPRAGGEAAILHGYAVAWGLAVELFISAATLGFPTDQMRRTVRFITDHYGRPAITCDDYEALYALMLHDKKNTAGHINFTLLSSPGAIHIDQHVDKDLIFDALDFLREA